MSERQRHREREGERGRESVKCKGEERERHVRLLKTSEVATRGSKVQLVSDASSDSHRIKRGRENTKPIAKGNG